MIRKALVSLAALVAAFSPAAHAESGWHLLNMTQGVTDISRRIYGLHMLILWVCVIIGIVVFAVTFLINRISERNAP
jgi:cytochrome c oxidase subunit 2